MNLWKRSVAWCSEDALYIRSTYFAFGLILLFIVIFAVTRLWPISLWSWMLIVLPLGGGAIVAMVHSVRARASKFHDDLWIGNVVDVFPFNLIFLFLGVWFMPVVKVLRNWMRKCEE